MIRSTRIDSSNISDYENLIPENYSDMIRSGGLVGGVLYAADGDADRMIMVYVISARAGWLELIWVDVFDRNRCDSYYAELLCTLIRKERFAWGEPIKGLYAEFHTDVRFRAERLRNVIILSGLESSITKNNLYEFTLGAVAKRDFLQKTAGRMRCISLADADNALWDKLDTLIQEDRRPTPLPLFVNWDAYLQEESLICMNEETPCGILLFSRRGDSIVIDCAYVNDKLALAVMLGNAYTRLITKYSPDQKFLVPVVIDRTAKIVERLVPTAQRGDVVEAVMRLYV